MSDVTHAGTISSLDSPVLAIQTFVLNTPLTTTTTAMTKNQLVSLEDCQNEII